MKTIVRDAVLLLAVAAMCQAKFALAEDFHWASTGGPSATPVGEEKVGAAAQAPCPPCAQQPCGQQPCGCEACGSGCGCDLGCDECPCNGLTVSFGLDSFKGISDGFLNSNFGPVVGLNSATPIPGLQDYGLGWQTGISYAVYDLDGRIALQDAAQSQQQIFVTTGLYRKADGDRRVSFGLVYDWMVNNNWGMLATTPTMGQWRGQIEYALSGCNAVGIWGCARDLGSRQTARALGGVYTVETRAMSQVNMFWHHKFETGADSWLYLGIPERDRLAGDGSLLDWTIGATLQVPLSDRLALYANGSYGHPSQAAGVEATFEQTYDVSMGVVWYIGRHAVSHSINGACWMPYMPMGNNSNFLVDQRIRAAVLPGTTNP